MRSLWRRISARDDGVSLVELVMTTMMLGLVVGAMLSSFSSLQRAAARESSRSQTTDEVRLAMDRMTKDIRQAISIRAGSGPSYLEMDTFIDGVESRVIYDASSGTHLTRSVDGPSVRILERLQSTAVFLYAPDVLDPALVSITLVSKPENFSVDQSDVTLTSEVQLRNRG